MTNPTKIVQLSVLTFAVAISQAFRTVPAITINGIAGEMNAGPVALALFGGIFHWSFALMQIPVGLALDIFGVRHTMVAISGFTILGGAICALAPTINWLFLGQTLIGIGCAPAFMAAIVFTSKHWPAARFAGISGLVLALTCQPHQIPHLEKSPAVVSLSCQTSLCSTMSSRLYCWQLETKSQRSTLGSSLLPGMALCSHTDQTSKI
jgi:Major Facilitator Superfamily